MASLEFRRRQATTPPRPPTKPSRSFHRLHLSQAFVDDAQDSAMSLNGLDDVSVTQAYQGALAEAGGWCAHPRTVRTFARRANVWCVGSCSSTRRGMQSRCSPRGRAARERRGQLSPSTRRSRRSTASCCTAGARCSSNTCRTEHLDYSRVCDDSICNHHVS